MPFPNEHACRLENPDKYPKKRRINCDQKSDGKCIDVIYGIIRPGKSDVQALRYPKETWTASEARNHCSGRGGSFEAASDGDGANNPESPLVVDASERCNLKECKSCLQIKP